jgi:hypothetical protein
MYKIFFLFDEASNPTNLVLKSKTYVTVIKAKRKNLRKEMLVLAHGFKGFIPWLIGSIFSEHVAK